MTCIKIIMGLFFNPPTVTLLLLGGREQDEQIINGSHQLGDTFVIMCGYKESTMTLTFVI